MHHHTWLISVFLVETDFHHVGQASLKLLTSSDPPALASQNAGITGVSHHAQPNVFISLGSIYRSRIAEWYSQYEFNLKKKLSYCFTRW